MKRMKALIAQNKSIIFSSLLFFSFFSPAFAQIRSELEKFDTFTQYKDALYKGSLDVRFQSNASISLSNQNIKGNTYTFDLYIKNKSRLYYFYNQNKKMIYKLLYTNNKIYTWDPKRRKLYRKTKVNMFETILDSGLNFLDLALIPYSQRFQIDNSLKLRQKKVIQKGFHAKEKENETERFPEDLYNFSKKDLQTIYVNFKLKSPYKRIHLKLDKKKKRPLRLDYFNYKSLLQRTIYPSYRSSIYDEAKKKLLKITPVLLLRVQDYPKESISTFRIKSYNSSFNPKKSLFDPRYIEN